MKCSSVVNSIGYTYPCNREKVAFQGRPISPEIVTDTVKIVKKSPVAEFRNYVANWRRLGESFEPTSENPNSVFMEYFNYRKEACMPQPARKHGGMTFRVKPSEVKIMTSDSEFESLLKFKDFIQTKSELATKEDYYNVVEEIASLMPEYVGAYHKSLRPEIKERSGDIFRWRSYLEVETKVGDEVVPTKFFDAQKKEEALRNYVEFVENLTGKKVLIGSSSRSSIAVNELGILNDPDSYKDVDYILFGHGKGSSLITDTEHEGTWRFSDSGESVWKFIEENVPKGKRVLVAVCEKDKFYREGGSLVAERRNEKAMYDKSGHYMQGIGDTVEVLFGREHPVKICESGIRHIIGHTLIDRYKGFPTSFIHGAYGKTSTVYYDL